MDSTDPLKEHSDQAIIDAAVERVQMFLATDSAFKEMIDVLAIRSLNDGTRTWVSVASELEQAHAYVDEQMSKNSAHGQPILYTQIVEPCIYSRYYEQLGAHTLVVLAKLGAQQRLYDPGDSAGGVNASGYL